MDIITIDRFMKFVKNELPHDVMVEVEKALITNKTANAVFHSLLFDYETRLDVEELIGEDEEKNNIWEEREKKYDEFCENLKNSGSKGVNDCLTNKTTPNMSNVHLTNEEMTKVTERYNVINEAYDMTLSLNDNLVNAYMGTFPDLTKDEASEVVGKLINGCDILTSRYQEALANGFDAEKEIAGLCVGKTTAQRYLILVNALVAVQTLNLDSFASVANIKEQMDKAIDAYTNSKPEPAEKDCEELQQMLAEALESNTLVLNGVEEAKKFINNIGYGVERVIDFASDQYDDARYKAEMALATWLAFKTGEINSVPKDATPESIGIGVATATEEVKVMDDVARGKKTVDMAVKCLKILGGVSLICLIGIAVMVAALFVTGTIISAAMTIFGDSLLACIVAMILAIPLSFGIANVGVETGVKILDKASQVYDIIIEKLRESIFPKIAETARKIIAWLKLKISDQNTSIDVQPTAAL